MSKKSRFFSAMSIFFNNDNNTKTSNKKAASKQKIKRSHDILLSNQSASKSNSYTWDIPISKSTTGSIDVKPENAISSFEIQILDKTQNTPPIIIHVKPDPSDDTSKQLDSKFHTAASSVSSVEINDINPGESMSVDNVAETFNNTASVSTQSHDVDMLRNNQESVVNEINIINYMSDCIESEDDFEERKHQIKNEKTDSSVKSKSKHFKKREKFDISKMLTVSETGSFLCTLCDASFAEKKLILNHMHKHERLSKVGFKCSICDERFYWKSYLKRHLKEHFDANDLDRNIELDLLKHNTLNSINTKPDASKTGKTPTDHDTFNELEEKLKSNKDSTHSSLIKLVNDNNSKVFKLACGYCELSFISQTELVEHCRIHMTDHSFICNICGTLFKQKRALVYHTRIHFQMMRRRKKKTEMPYIKYVLKVYSCTDCERSYVSWSTLNQHKLNVHGNVSDELNCKICGGTYFSRYSFRGHKRFCSASKKRSTTKKTLASKKAREVKYTCAQCTQTFQLKRELRQHNLIAHLSS